MGRIHEEFDIDVRHEILGYTHPNTEEEKIKAAKILCKTCTDECQNTSECVLDMLGLPRLP